MYANTSSTDLGVSRTLSSLSNQNRLQGAHAEISIGRSDPKASRTSGAIVSRQFEQSGMAFCKVERAEHATRKRRRSPVGTKCLF
jgi:hypothetical protein